MIFLYWIFHHTVFPLIFKIHWYNAVALVFTSSRGQSQLTSRVLHKPKTVNLQNLKTIYIFILYILYFSLQTCQVDSTLALRETKKCSWNVSCVDRLTEKCFNTLHLKITDTSFVTFATLSHINTSYKSIKINWLTV